MVLLNTYMQRKNKRYAVLVQADEGEVQFVDGGIWQEDHGDHLHPYQEAPALMEYHLDGVKPAHVTVGENNVAVFFDGNKDTGDNAEVAVFNEQLIAENGTEAHLEYSTYMHGAAQPRGEFFIEYNKR